MKSAESNPAKIREAAGRKRNYLRQRGEGGFARSAALLTAGTAVAQAFSLLAAPLLTRLYNAQAFGRFALFTSFIGMASVGVSLKYELGIVSASSDAEAAQLTYASVLMTAPTSLVSGGLLYVAIHWSLLGFGTLPVYSIVLAVGTLALIGIFTALRYWTIRRGGFSIIAKTTVWQYTSRAMAQVLFGTIAAGSAALMLGELVGRATGMVHLSRESWKQLREPLTGLEMCEIVRTMNANRKLVVYSLPSTFIDTAVVNLPVPLLVRLYGIEAGGYFALVQRVLAVPLGLIATSVADTFHSNLALCARDNPWQMPRLFKRTSLWLFLLGMVPAGLLASFGEPLFRMIFGSQWTSAGALAALSTPWFLTQFVVSPLSRLVFVLSGQEMKLVYDVVILAGMLAVALISFRAGWGLSKTVWAFSLINAIAYVLYYLILVGIINKAISGPECEAHR